MAKQQHCSSTHMKKQWAAVRTHCASMMVPPQMWTGPYCTLTCQGHLLTEASFPPMIRPEILCPQAGGKSRAERRAQREGKAWRRTGTTSPPPTGTSGARYSHRGQWTPWECNHSFLLPRRFAAKRTLFAQPCAKKGGKQLLPLAIALPASPLLVHRRETYFPVRHCELQERRGNTASDTASQHRGRGRRQRCWVPVEALLDGLVLVGHREALAGDVQGNVFSL